MVRYCEDAGYKFSSEQFCFTVKCKLLKIAFHLFKKGETDIKGYIIKEFDRQKKLCFTSCRFQVEQNIYGYRQG